MTRISPSTFSPKQLNSKYPSAIPSLLVLSHCVLVTLVRRRQLYHYAMQSIVEQILLLVFHHIINTHKFKKEKSEGYESVLIFIA